MCGIAGLFSRTGKSEVELRRQAVAMADSIIHRGPDDDGVWVDAAKGVALSFRRLSIIDLSPLGHQPMISGSGRYVIVFNGEIYNHRDLRRLLKSDTWRGGSDTETLLAGIDRWGIRGALERAVGMFAFAIWDRWENCLTLARDRLGEKPLYFGILPDGDLLFGSELKALKAHPHWQGTIHPSALSAFMRYSTVPGSLSIYKEAQKLLPGCLVEIRENNAPVESKYWTIGGTAETPEDAQTLSDEEMVDRLDNLLTDVVQHQMMADVPIGAFLSGGIDSSTIVAMMCKGGASNVRTFSIGFEDMAYNEAPYAKKIAEYLGTAHSEEYITPRQALEVISKIPTIYDEPFADSSQLPTFLLCGSARRDVTVALTGDGADELFAGYDRYRIASSIWPWISATPRPIRKGLGRLIKKAPVELLDRFVRGANIFKFPVTFNGERLHKFADSVLVAPSAQALYLSLVSSWQAPEVLVVGGDAARQEGPAGNLTLVESMCRMDLEHYLPDDILVKVDRAAMAVSLETRAPFLDHRIVDFATGLSPNRKIRQGKSKWILRRVLDRYVPQHLIDRPKQGFGVPIGAWMRGPLREWAEDLLSEGELRKHGLLHAEPIREKWREHLSGRYNWQFPLWTVLMFQAWYRHAGNR